ncbi:DUF2586 family protein [Flavobacterium oreochromis]|uniref:DUF2586 family protein n=1 Tax=Flavobacterium oreochromis TaxID=2906078 RepID=UPI000CDA777C|nr:hypothetical protein BWK58_06610 [Flavobacterium columnare]
MADLKGFNIEKGKQGASILDNSEGVTALVVSTPVPQGLEYQKPFVIYNCNDAKAKGITPEFDTTNNVNVYRHIYEYYRLAKEGNPLYIMVVEQNKTITEMTELAKKLLVFAGGYASLLGIAVNLPANEVPIMLNGLPKNVIDGISKAQALYQWSYDNNMPCQIFLEGYNYSGIASAVADLRGLTNLEADKVTVFIGQDYQHAKGKTGLAKKYADIGTVLGVASKALVHQNIGNNELFNITDATKDTWLEPALSSNVLNIDCFSDLQTLENKGFVFGINYTGLAGVRINNDHVCAPIKMDADKVINEHTVAYGRTMNKAVRKLRTAYLPKIKTDWFVDKATGALSPATIVALEDIGNKVFAQMIKEGNISYGKTIVDKNSDLLVQKTLFVSFVIVPKGTIGEIQGTINLKTQV